ncbi:MAG: N-acetylmuramoyl-L-alanine amidase [Clostridia bacterium]|nr:N-acetylmuramoyl-L-alanine amidase [Clostridia bacterium]
MKKVIILSIVFSIILSCINTVAAAQDTTGNRGIGIYVDGERLELQQNPIIVKGRTLVPVRAVSEKFEANVQWYPVSTSIKISTPGTMISMRLGSNRVYVDSVLKKLDVAPRLVNGITMVPVRFIAEAMNSQVTWDPTNGAVNIISNKKEPPVSRGDEDRRFKVVIDAGHGGKEVGANYFGVYEKDLNLQISKTLEEMLRAEGIKTYMTRTGDSTLGLYERAELANGVDADVLVSVHNNAGSSRTTGTMTLYYPGDTNSNGNLTARRFAEIVQNELTSTLGSGRLGVIQRPNLAVLRNANMPAVIAEVGYMSNRAELAKLNTQEYRNKAAEALKNAVLKAMKAM